MPDEADMTIEAHGTVTPPPEPDEPTDDEEE